MKPELVKRIVPQYPLFSPVTQVRAVDVMNYDFQALALESRGMGEVSGLGPNSQCFLLYNRNNKSK